MNWSEGQIQGVVVEPVQKCADERGWLTEIFRSDELPAEMMPVMGYVSVTKAGMARGPHEHCEQTDRFAFLGPGTFMCRFWDKRDGSPTFGRMKTVYVGEDNPSRVIVPPGVVHGYKNVSDIDGWVVNMPNRLYAGEGRQEAVDEVRYEDQASSEYALT